MGASNIFSSPNQADNLLNAGIALHRDGNLFAAKSIYERLLGIDDENIAAIQLLALVYSSRGEPDNALKLIDHALKIDPSNAASHHLKGIVMVALERASESLSSYDQAISLKSDDPKFYKDRGLARYECGLAHQAMSDFEKAIELTPTDSSLFTYIGIVFNKLRAYDKAIQAFDKAVEIEPVNAKALYSRGESLKNLDRVDDALVSVNSALEICPDLEVALVLRGDVLIGLDKPREALSAYDAAISYDQSLTVAHNNRGAALFALGWLEEACESYDRALELDPDYPAANWNRALLYLRSGDYARGWALYEWRLADKDRYPSYTQPSWRGDYDISDKRLFIPAEQGLGDLIQFCRYAPLLTDLALEVIVEVPRALRPVLESLCPKITLSVKDEVPPEFDVVCPLMSLPHAFNTTLETIPSSEKYLTTELARVAIWRERLGKKQKKRIGVVWSGAPAHKDDINRSIYLGELVSIMDDSFEWHSLQKEYRPDDWDVLENSPQIHQHQEDLQDFSDTAALIECMDLVITVDTSVAHLAGALGKPVWIMLSKLPDFRWLLGRKDSPWYASARLYRQEEKGDWTSVLVSLRRDLNLKIPSSCEGTNCIGGGINVGARVGSNLQRKLRLAQNLHKTGNLCSAGNLYQGILQINPDHPEALKLLATVYSAQGRYAEAENLFNASIDQCSTDPVTFSNRGSNRSSSGSLIKAIEDFDKAIAIKPDYLLAHFNKGNVYRKLGDLQDARRCYECALALDPHYASALYNLGNTCHDLGEYEGALSYYQRTLAVESTRAGAALGCGLAQHRLGFLEQASASYDRAVELDPDYPEAHWNRALLYLLSGDYARGWPLYEWRLADKDRYPSYTQPSWRGDYDISDKRLFIPAEQGLGDLIQFCRYAPLLTDLALEVIVEVPRALRPVLESLCPKITLSVKDEVPPEFDVVCPLMSLPHAFNTTLETIPSSEKYLTTELARVAIWRERLGKKQKKRIGVVWSGAPAHKDDINRSIYLGELVSIMDDSFEWHSLQKEYRPDDWDVLENSPQIHQHQEDLQDFSDTAALIECMDLVITVDTSVAHLAGALGKPVWIMLSKLPDFRWLLGRKDSPWYASARLYRQEEKGDWTSVLSAIATSLPGANIST